MGKPNNGDSVTIELNKKILDTTALGYNKSWIQRQIKNMMQKSKTSLGNYQQISKL